ncbi:molybdenum cofactor biosynthesis protein MoaD [Methanoculleus taiwanensis]|uniref:Molybdenum cofactor biosynthesis protein MoaD n=1 Tax=Methanoculleus taiwanensis TaxID=1550565 RepID=A0A498H2T2_9EURY|nr:ubiquitin-like small modifier protein 1 [Methanoculleus taiwanensis]RXE57113.1 molybdenum cofactor biosynthesis protein MoaD [Methanoculleus taiwanensis]
MQVKVRAFAGLREALGGERLVEISNGATMKGLLDAVGGTSATAAAALFEESGELKGHVILMRNGKRVGRADIETLALAEGDEIALFPPVAGG